MTRTLLLWLVACGPPLDDKVGADDTDSGTDDSGPRDDTGPSTHSDTDGPDDTGQGRATRCGPLGGAFTPCTLAVDPRQATLPDGILTVPHTDAALADLDGDGWLDVCASRHPGRLTCHLDRGGLDFGPGTEVTQGLAFGVVATDLDADGHVDLVVPEVAIPTDTDLGDLEVRLTLLKGRGDGTFEDVSDAAGLGALPVQGCDSPTPQGVHALHLDTDDRLDLVVRMQGTCPPFVFRGRPGLTFARSISTLPDPVESGLLTLDLDLDGHLDLLTYSFGEPPARAYRGLTGVFTRRPFAAPFDGEHASRPRGCGAGDIDGDGLLDVYCGDHGRQTLLRLGADGEATDVTQALGAAVPTTLGGDVPITWSSWIVDLDGRDGPDLVAASGFEELDEPWAQETVVLMQQPDGRFRRSTDGPLGQPYGARGLVVADLDGNRCPDLLLLPIDREAPGRPLQVLLGAGCAHGLGPVTATVHTGQEAVGAKVVGRWSDGTTAAWRVTKSGGDEGAGPASFWPTARDPSATLVDLTVHWPDTTTSVHAAAEAATGAIRQPAGLSP
ncbi:MAG: VCBS repeat-containing protein [Alphaproteobacteria bacterium]|nr:VCBS repeat-containing protein [Alphaproteobacteria bacterium]